jgi:ribonuclease G
VMTEPCPYCSGTGTIKSTPTICYEILTEVKKIGLDLNGQRLLLRVNPEIARALKDEEREVMRDLKAALGKEVTVKPDAQLHHEQFDLMAV